MDLILFVSSTTSLEQIPQFFYIDTYKNEMFQCLNVAVTKNTRFICPIKPMTVENCLRDGCHIIYLTRNCPYSLIKPSIKKQRECIMYLFFHNGESWGVKLFVYKRFQKKENLVVIVWKFYR